ncbi:MAG: hypothetical protein ACOCX2_08850 [Armatimonadota bacterium]
MSDWLKKANKVLGDIAGEAGRQAEGVQLQAKLGSLDKQLDEVYIEAGKRAEELLQARQVHDDELRVILERARGLKEKMMEVRQRAQDLRQKPEPEEEDAEQPEPPPEPADAPPQPRPHEPEAAEAVQPQPTPSATPEQAMGEKACPTCGGEVTTHMVFCPHCGAELEE